MDVMTIGGHGVIVGLLIWILNHVRSIRIEMKNGNGNGRH
jgi:hypothetical protein